MISRSWNVNSRWDEDRTIILSSRNNLENRLILAGPTAPPLLGVSAPGLCLYSGQYSCNVGNEKGEKGQNGRKRDNTKKATRTARK